MSVFGVGLIDLLLLTFCFSLPFAVLAVIVTVLYRRDRHLTPPEPDTNGPEQPVTRATGRPRPARAQVAADGAREQDPEPGPGDPNRDGVGGGSAPPDRSDPR